MFTWSTVEQNWSALIQQLSIGNEKIAIHRNLWRNKVFFKKKKVRKTENRFFYFFIFLLLLEFLFFLALKECLIDGPMLSGGFLSLQCRLEVERALKCWARAQQNGPMSLIWFIKFELGFNHMMCFYFNSQIGALFRPRKKLQSFKNWDPGKLKTKLVLYCKPNCWLEPEPKLVPPLVSLVWAQFSRKQRKK